jgi:ribosomal protection tetracycline resistance protein
MCAATVSETGESAPQGVLNLGILAHVDAGKTTLTERLLYTAGVISEIGSVDKGTTQTDSMSLERQRGITIRAAVIAFTVDGVTVNIIDTPGHPDFIAEVDRTLGVLDGAVLVISAVEGVQAQTIVLMRALQRLAVPTLIFLNKIDRRGADPDRVLAAIRARLSRHVVVMGAVRGAGERTASFAPFAANDEHFMDELIDVLADHDEVLLETVVADRDSVSPDDLQTKLAEQTASAEVHPVFLGSAITGEGAAPLMAALTRLLPKANRDPEAPALGSVFKVERSTGGDKVAYVRMFVGTIHVRERVPFGEDDEATVTGLRVFQQGGPIERSTATAGEIAKVSGLRDVRVGDDVGSGRRARHHHGVFSAPMLETAVVPCDPEQKAALHAALARLAESDPLINLRQDDVRQELFLSLYGEVQKEVIEQLLESEYGIEIEYRETTTICIERVVGVGSAIERLRKRGNPFLATLGLHLERGPRESGVEVRLDLDVRTVPLYVYKTVDAFHAGMEAYVRSTLRQGLYGWEVTDCIVTVTECAYLSPGTQAADYRKLTPLVLMAALKLAGTVVCEPIQHFQFEGPADSLSAVLQIIAQRRGVPQPPEGSGRWVKLQGDLPAAEVHRLRQQLHGLTHGEGVLEVDFDRYEPVVGRPPTRQRSDISPMNRKEYLLHVLQRM